VTAESPETADSISQVLQGLVALGRLMAAQRPHLAPLNDLAESLTIRTRASRISIRISYDARELLQKAARMLQEHGGARHGRDDDWDDWDFDDDDWDDDDDDDDRRHRTHRKRSHDG